MRYLLDLYRLLHYFRLLIENILSVLPVFSFFVKTRHKEYPITLKIWFQQKVMGANKHAYWPMHPSSLVTFSQKILIGKNVFPGYQYGCFIHGQNGIYIGDYSFIAPNVGIISGNHDLYDLRNQTICNPTKIGAYCWLGMNSMILPNVELGDFTIVGAGSVVTKSFKDGHCIIAGNPAKLIKHLDPNKCIRYEEVITHIGYIPIEQFDSFKNLKLDL